MPGETATDRTLQYKVEACFWDGLFGRKVGSGLKFEITTSDKGKDDVDQRWTNNDGCLNWFGFLSHKYFRKEVLEKKVAKVKFLDDNENPFEDEYTYYMNPWDEKWTFGWDARDMPEGYPAEIKKQRDEAPDSRIFIPAFKYETMGFRYSIDRFLNLKVKKTVLLSLYAFTLKYNSIILGRGATEILRDGIYLMKVALQKDYRDPAASNKVKIRISDDGFSNQNVGSIIDQVNENINQLNEKCKDNNKECISQPRYESTLLSADDLRAIANQKCVNSDNQAICRNKFAHENYPKCDTLNLNFDNCMEEIFQDSNNEIQDLNDETRKQSIAIQQKLVRVLGGRIITPIEFEMSDLRLMRLRNQLFIQLETIDENKLKLATRISDIFENWYDNHNFEKHYKTIFDMLGMLGVPEQYEQFNKDWDKIFEENNVCFMLREIKTSLNNSDRDLFTNSFKKDWDQIFGSLEDDKICSRFKEVWANSKSEVWQSSKSRDFKVLERIISQIHVIYKDLKNIGDQQDINPIRDEVYEVFGLNEDTPEYEKRKEQIHGFLNRMFRYQFYDLNEKDSFKNERRRIINQYVENFGLQDEEYSGSTKIDENTYINADTNNETSFFQRFMSPSSFNEDGFINIIETVVEEKLNNDENFKKLTEEEKENLREEEIENFRNEMRASDFASTPLTPNFDFDLLSNAGQHKSCDSELSKEDCKDDGKSGLPARTFVGPITLLFNTNTSHLRPTDILNEQYCQSAICNKWDTMELVENGVPTEDLPEIDGNHFEVNGNTLTMHGRDFQGVQGESSSVEIFDTRDSLNSSYENKYYGFLKDYYNTTVDDLIEEKKELDKRQTLKMELDSQLINFVRSMRLKHVAISQDVDPDLRLREIDFSQCEKEGKLSKTCYSDLDFGPEVLSKETFIEQLNGPPIRLNISSEKAKSLVKVSNRNKGEAPQISYLGGSISLNDLDRTELTETDLYKIIKLNPGEEDYDFTKHREFTHRMCTVLTRNLFSEDFLPDYGEDYMPSNTDTLHDVNIKKREIFNRIEDGVDDGFIKLGEKRIGMDSAERLLAEIDKYALKLRDIGDIERLCNQYIDNLYIGDRVCDPSLDETCTGERLELSAPDMEVTPDTKKVKYSPILFEKRMRVLKTTGRYVYRGGKSFNINVLAGFNLTHTASAHTNFRTAYKPYNWIRESLAIGGSWLLASTLIPFGGIVVAGGAIGLSSLVKGLFYGFDVSRSNSRDESVTRGGGTSIQSGVFLVTQQADFDLELGEYERCLVVRFHPFFLREMLDKKDELFKPDFDDEKDFQSLGVMICSGKKENCLPVKERYYYVTQHFTEGDMLDMADLHNHPWMLQLRGKRDFMTFTTLIGGREMEYVDNMDNVLSQTLGDSLSDMKIGNYHKIKDENKASRFQVVNRQTDIDWSQKELSRAYFEVLPTFPGLYTMYEEDPMEDWPWRGDIEKSLCSSE